MTAKFYYLHPDGTVDVTDRVDRRVGWEVKEAAEEGVTPISQLALADPDMDQEFDGHRAFAILEDESEIDDDVLFYGWTWNQVVSRGEGDNFDPLGRAWQVDVTDRNAFWQRRVMVGADCKRPAETDVERIQWLLATSEASLFDDVTTYVSTANPVNMDKCDYRGQMFAQVMDDCAQASGKNWYAWVEHTGLARDFFAWYGRDSLTTRSSTLSLSNDPADWLDAELLDGTSLVWPISEDTKLSRDPSRTYSGVYLAYDGGAVYRYDSTTAAAFAKRDFPAPSSNVKTSTKAAARATRYLNELDAQDDRITTTVELPKAKGTMIRAGMRIPFKATHLPGYTSYQWMRVLSCTIRPAAGGERYRLTLELAPNGNGTYTPPFSGSAFAALLRADGPAGGVGYYEAAVTFQADGDTPPAGWIDEPTVGPLSAVYPSTIEATAAMVVRIESRVSFYTVVTGPNTVTMEVRVDGVTIGSDSDSRDGGLGIWEGELLVDVHDVSLDAGSVVDIWWTSDNPGPGNDGANATYLRVGRGTQTWNGGADTWVGP